MRISLDRTIGIAYIELHAVSCAFLQPEGGGRNVKIKLVLSDFDGTITQTDVLDMICELVGKGAASQHINNLFVSGQKDGKEALIERFSLLEGLELSSIYFHYFTHRIKHLANYLHFY